MTHLGHTRPLSQVEVEQGIARVIEQMETETEAYDDLSQAAAEAEADYRRDVAMTTLAVIHHGESKLSAKERDAKIDLTTADAHRRYLTTQAARNSKREHLQTMRAHLDALRTLNASIRGQT